MQQIFGSRPDNVINGHALFYGDGDWSVPSGAKATSYMYL